MERVYLDTEIPRPIRDEVTIYNVGRSSAIILKIGAPEMHGKSRELISQLTMPTAAGDVPVPPLPLSLPSQGVLRVAFNVLFDAQPGLDHGYGFIYLRPRAFRDAVRERLTVKALPDDERRTELPEP